MPRRWNSFCEGTKARDHGMKVIQKKQNKTIYDHREEDA